MEGAALQLLQAISNGLQMGLLYALVAVGLAIIWGLMETINFAHGELMMLGMFGSWWLSAQFGIDPLVAMVPIALVLYGVGVVIYRLLMRRVQRGEVFTQIFATFGLLLFLQNSVVAVFTSDYRFANNTVLTNLSGVNLSIGRLTIGLPLLIGGLIALVLFLALYLVVDRTELGLALQATSEDRDAAVLVGVKPIRMYAIAWGLGAALVAVAGVILGNFFAIYPQIGLQFTILAYAIVALGGFGSILGTLVAALLVGVIQSLSGLYLPPAFKDAFVYASYLLIGLFRPQGLFGRF
jgi:branched-chain amino acid transport system permease protein